MTIHPVAGKRVLVTRAAHDADRWAARLAALGAHPVVLPCLVCQPISDDETGRALRDAVAHASWLLVTSARGCEAAGRLLLGTVLPGDLRIAAVGAATATAAAKQLGRVDLVAREGTSSGLARELIRLLRREGRVAAAHVVVVGAAGGRDAAAVMLEVAGVNVRRMAVYRTIPAPATATRRDLAADGIEIVLLASPSAVTGLLGRALVPGSVRVVTIGPTTSAAARAAGLVIAAEAVRPTLEGILEAIV